MYVCTEYKYIKGYTLLMYIYIRVYVCVSVRICMYVQRIVQVYVI